jgi:hypothetical protein
MLITVGDCDAVRVDHAVRFLQLRGGDVNGDFVGVPASRLAAFPGTTHLFGLAKTELVLEAVLPFLDTPPEGQQGVRERSTTADLDRAGARPQTGPSPPGARPRLGRPLGPDLSARLVQALLDKLARGSS